MTVAGLPIRFTDKADESRARYEGIDRRAGMTGRAGAVHLARCDSSYTHSRAFLAPDRAIAIPDGDGGAVKGLPGWDDGDGG